MIQERENGEKDVQEGGPQSPRSPTDIQSRGCLIPGPA
jgi:hypothetical protein